MTSTETITIVMADDHALVREALSKILNAESDLRVLAVVNDADEAVRLAVELSPRIVILDIDMPGLCCFDAARTIKKRCPKTDIIFLSGFFQDHYIQEALELQALGYVSKSEPPAIVMAAIRAAAAGEMYFSSEIQSRIVIDAGGARLASGPIKTGRTRASTLTDRELEALRYLARGLSTKDIAQTMHISMRTVERHKANLMTKLDIHDRVELTRFAIREGLAEA